jgi:hypothetical protein
MRAAASRSTRLGEHRRLAAMQMIGAGRVDDEPSGGSAATIGA